MYFLRVFRHEYKTLIISIIFSILQLCYKLFVFHFSGNSATPIRRPTSGIIANVQKKIKKDSACFHKTPRRHYQLKLTASEQLIFIIICVYYSLYLPSTHPAKK